MAQIEVNNRNFEIHNVANRLALNESNIDYDIITLPNGDYHMALDNKSYTIKVLDKNTSTGNLTVLINGRTISTTLQNKLAKLLKSMGMESGKRKLKELKAPMPGLVLNVLVKVGDEVTEGQELIILEAMKMENVIKSPQDGIIQSIVVQNQDKVEKNQILIEFD
ncbi:acetyl-CoA carboxylase biotin carboxyl carrier protein subunit [Bacteroidia bacterium]|nr:acetyl-CoA carboxylase biotin carboxyl carrier protein subunit [Bacteroidia bacterium]